MNHNAMQRLTRVLSVLLPLLVVLGVLPAVIAQPAAAGPADLTPPAPPVPLAVPAGSVTSAASAGYLAGSGSVGPDGSYHYQIGLDVPQGRAGMQPQLALSYSSTGGNGTLGLGWSLAGLSSIGRCARSLSTEGSVSGVTLGQGDRFCIDGQKLVALSGTYGANGTEYRTETDAFAKIVSEVDATSNPADGPDRFVVYLKNGLVRTYGVRKAAQLTQAVGFTPNPSQTTSSATRKVQWLLDTEADRSSNEVRYEYLAPTFQDGGNEYLPRKITYTWNTGSVAKAAQRTIDFKYDLDQTSPNPKQRPDTSFSYQAGVRFNLTQRLREIRMSAPNQNGAVALAWTYTLSYWQQISGRSVLQSVAKCSPTGGCLRAKKFAYNNPTSVPFFASTNLGTQGLTTTGKEPAMQVADLDGDGTDDIVYTTGGTSTLVHVRTGMRTATTGAVFPLKAHLTDSAGGAGSALPANTDISKSRPVDVQTDGAAELVVRGQNSAGTTGDTLLRWDRTQGRFVPPPTPVSLAASWTTDFADLNGDGLLDWLTADVPQDPVTLACHQQCYSVRLGTGDGTGPSFTTPVASKVSSGLEPRATDFDGDGRAELVLRSCTGFICSPTSSAMRLDANNQVQQVTVSTVANGVTYFTAAPTLSGYNTMYGDFNGDGLGDALLVRVDFVNPHPKDLYLLWSTGNGLVLDSHDLSGVVYDHTYPDLRIADLNSDGRDDIVSFYDQGSAGHSAVNLSRGDGSFAPGADIDGFSGTVDPEVGRSTTQLGDFNGDGRLDVVRIVNSQLNALIQGERYADLLTEVSDGGTAWYRDHVDYSSTWTDHVEHLGDFSCSYPLTCPRRGIVVVRKVTSKAAFADGSIGVPAEVSYSYEDPVRSLRGRGDLGFGVLRTWDPLHATETVTKYDHRFALNGLYYPGAFTPQEVTTVTPVLTPAQLAAKPTSATARVTRTTSTWQVEQPYGPASSSPIYQLFTDQYVDTKTWEQPVSVDWSVSLAGSHPAQHVSGVANQNPLREATVFTQHDLYGNATTVTRTTVQPLGVKAVTVTGFDDIDARKADWLVSLPTRVTETRFELGAAGLPRTDRHTDLHFTAQGLLETVRVEKDNTDPDVRSTVTYGYDTLGVRRTTTLSSPGLANRVKHVEYTPLPAGWHQGADEEVYPVQEWAEHDQAAYRPSTWTITHPAYGVPLFTEDANGVVATTRIDNLGRPVAATPAGAAATQLSYANRADAAGGSNGTTVTTTKNNITTVVNSDALGRTLTSSVTGFDGTPAVTKSSYDVAGRTASTTAPAPGGTTVYTYDTLNRTLTTTPPDGKATSYAYPDLFTTTVTDAANHQGVTVLDADGRVKSSTGKLVRPNVPVEDVTTSYTYAPFDLRATATDDAGNITSTGYDVLGRATTVTEPDRGTTTSTYYGTGDLHTSGRTAAGTTTYGYDDLGRKVTASNTAEGASTFTYDSAANGIGKLASATSPDGITTGYRYDSAGRQAGVDVTDQASSSATMSMDYHYNASGQPSYTEYPDPDGSGTAARFAVSYGYLLPDNSTHGYPVKISNTTPGFPAQPLWTVSSRQPNLSLDTATLGSGPGAVTVKRSYYGLDGKLKGLSATTAGGTKLQDLVYGYTDNDRVLTRTQNDTSTGGANRVDTYGYDTLDRLTGWTLANGTAAPRTTGYTYDTLGNLGLAGTDEHRFDDPAHPHRLTTRDDSTAGGEVESFDYDPDGRQTATRNEAGVATRQLTYTQYDLPRTVTRNGNTTTFSYDAFGAKAKEVTKNGAGATVATTYYLAGAYEKRITFPSPTTTVTTQVYYVSGTDGPVAQVVTSNNGASYTTQYTVPDNLGSTSATLNDAGQLTQALRYDPWGSRINADGSAFTGSTNGVNLGYTGHEHEDALGLINMKGRYYDPGQKIFTTPDPLNTAAANPYSYVDNSPANNTDPSGYVTCEFVVSGPCESYGGALGSGPTGTGNPWVPACIRCFPGTEPGNTKPGTSDGTGNHQNDDDSSAGKPTAVDSDPPTTVAGTQHSDVAMSDQLGDGLDNIGVTESSVFAEAAGVTLLGDLTWKEWVVVGALGAATVGLIVLTVVQPELAPATATTATRTMAAAGSILAGGAAAGGLSTADLLAAIGITAIIALARKKGTAEIVVDTNVVANALNDPLMALRVDAALAGRAPVVAPASVIELAQGVSNTTILNWVNAHQGRIGTQASATQIAQLQAVGASMTPARVLKTADAQVLSTAMQEGLPVMTADKKFRNFMSSIGYPNQGY